MSEGPQTQTVEQAIQQFFSSVLEPMMPGISAQFASPGLTWLLKMFTGNPVEFGATFSTNMTPEGVFTNNARLNAGRIGDNIAKQYQRSLLADRFRDFERSRTSLESFAKRKEAAGLEGATLRRAYDAYIEKNVGGMMRLPMVETAYSFLNNMFGFDQDYLASQHIANAMGAISKQSFLDNDRSQMTIGSYALKNLFTGGWSWKTDEDGNPIYDAAGNRMGDFDQRMRFNSYEWGGWT